MGQNETLNDDNKNWVYLLEPDPPALARANRRIQTTLFGIFAFFATAICWIWWISPPGGARPSLPLLAGVWVGGMLLSLLAFRVRGMVKENQAWIGADFLAASDPVTGRGITIAPFQDIVAVTIGLAKGRIVEVVVRAKRPTWVYLRHVKDPAVAVRAIFESGPAHVKWRCRGWPFTRLTRDEVAALIDDAGLPSMNALLPPGATWGRIDEMFVRDAKGRLSAGGSVRRVNMVARKSPATEVR
ncbi:MAG TPA: hypothetical protein PLU87_02080 [Sedimentisphaerales bacterium]|nr:hypothetical protein [Sedimentisphaerales bacterium]HRS09831.1 hypothetical protein [Sedimentisphaerales bacterium]HRV46519.1 hypothetical protein [Sedimentisphaerales bacterium]